MTLSTVVIPREPVKGFTANLSAKALRLARKAGIQANLNVRHITFLATSLKFNLTWIPVYAGMTELEI